VININLVSLVLSNIGINFQLPLVVKSCIYRRAQFSSDQECYFHAYVDGVMAYAQIYTLTCTALERYKVASNHLKVYEPQAVTSLLKLALVWVGAALLSGLPYVGFGSFSYDGLRIHCTINYFDNDVTNVSFLLVSTCLGFVAPLCVIFFCYVAITRIFRTVTSQTSASVTSRAQRKDRARNVALMWTTVKAVITFVCGWTPYCAMVVLVVLGRPVSPALQFGASITAKVSSTTNAVVYAFGHPDFKKYVTKKVGKRMRLERTTVTTTHV